MYRGEPQIGSDSERHSIPRVTYIIPKEGTVLYDLCRELKPKNSLEIGLGYGYSTVYFLAAIRENGVGYHTAVDPVQRGEEFHGIGSRHAHTLGMSDIFRWIEDRSVPVLVHCAERDEKFEMIFINGSHRFDDVLVDFTLSAALCPMGGCIILDDMWLPSIYRVAAFIRSNRKDFEELNTPEPKLAAFRRIGEDTQDRKHFVEFFETSDIERAVRRFVPAFPRRAAKALLRPYFR